MILDWKHNYQGACDALRARFGSEHVEILVNGVLTPRCFYLDEEQGVVRAYGLTHSGCAFVEPGQDHAAWYQDVGTIEIRPFPGVVDCNVVNESQQGELDAGSCGRTHPDRQTQS